MWKNDNGNSWIASANIPQNAVVASDRVNAKKFYGYGQGTFWISTDGGATFTATAATGLPVAGNAVTVKAMPGHEGDIWIAGGSTGNITLTNTGSTTISSWTLKFSFSNGQQVTQGWNGTFSQQGSQVTVQNLSYNGSLVAGNGSVSIGFNASWTTSNTNPTTFTLNGTTCSIS